MTDPASIPRDSRRVPLETAVQFKFDRFSGFLSEYSANVSPGGMYIRSQTPQENGTLLDFEFRLGDGYELIRGKGEVVWSRPYDEGPKRPAGMGIRFIELSEGSLDLIYKIVDQHVLQGGTPFDVAREQSAASSPYPAPSLAGPPSDPLDESLLTLHGFDRRPPLAPPSSAAARGPGSGEPPPDARSWMPSFEDLEAPAPMPPLVVKSPDEAADEAWAPPATPTHNFVPTFGAASAGSSRESRRGLPLVLAIGGFALIAVVFLLRDRIAAWVGVGGGEEVEIRGGVRPDLPRPLATPATPDGPGGLDNAADQTSDLAAASAPKTANPPSTSASAPPAPRPAPPVPLVTAAKTAPPPAPNPPVEAKGFTAVERITAEKAGDGTDVYIWLDGAISPSRYTRSGLGGNPPRVLIRLRGVQRRYPDGKVAVGSGEVLQVRTGYHAEGGLNELHVVLDLTRPTVVVTRVEEQPRRLRIHLQGK